MSGPVARVLLGAIRVYRAAISPLRPPVCRYRPTCSEYAVDALEVHGAWRGSWLAVRRLLRCHPFHAGGHDPVPPRVSRPTDQFLPSAVPPSATPPSATPPSPVLPSAVPPSASRSAA